MKKLCALLLSVSLLLALAACGGSGEEAPATPSTAPTAETQAQAAESPAPEPTETAEPEPEIELTWEEEIPAEKLTGRWYCRAGGTDLVLELLPAAPEETVSGLWRLEEGLIWLDEEETAIAVTEDGLYWYGLGALATREAPEPLYVPGEPVSNLAEGTLDGYWVTEYLELDGQIFPAEELGEELDLYLEGKRAALGGLFGDQIVDLEEAEGSLVFVGEGFRAEFVLLDDGLLRLTLSGDFEGTLVYYLLPLVLNNAEITEE